MYSFRILIFGSKHTWIHFESYVHKSRSGFKFGLLPNLKTGSKLALFRIEDFM